MEVPLYKYLNKSNKNMQCLSAQVLVHGPAEFPRLSVKGTALGRKTEMFVGISATYTKSSDEVKAMYFPRRKCIVKGEPASNLLPQHRLKAFKEYDRENCYLECRANAIRETCNCLPYFYPNFAAVWGNDTTCDFDGLKCLSDREGL